MEYLANTNKSVWLIVCLLLNLTCSEIEEFDYPVVLIGDIVNVTDTDATFTANITNLGNLEILESGFIYSVYSMDNNGVKIKNENTREGTFELKTNLQLLPSKTYYVRAYVQTESSVTYSKEISFKNGGEVNRGKWSPILMENMAESYNVMVLGSFTINNTTYFVLGDGDLFYYRHTDQEHGVLMSSTVLENVSLSFAYNGYGYLFNSLDGAFYRFDPLGKTFTKLNAPGKIPLNSFVTGFIINDDIYLGNLTTSNDFWKFNITQASWEQLSSFPSWLLHSRFSFSINNSGYVLGSPNWGYMYEMWQYFPDKDQWIRKRDLTLGFYTNMYCTSISDLGYCYVNHGFFEYNPVFDIWDYRASIPGKGIWYLSHLFIVNNEVYAISINPANTSEYDCQIWVYEK